MIGAKGSVQSAKMFHYVPITVAACVCGSIRPRPGDKVNGRRLGEMGGDKHTEYSYSLISQGNSVAVWRAGHIGVVLSPRIAAVCVLSIGLCRDR